MEMNSIFFESEAHVVRVNVYDGRLYSLKKSNRELKRLNEFDYLASSTFVSSLDRDRF